MADEKSNGNNEVNNGSSDLIASDVATALKLKDDKIEQLKQENAQILAEKTVLENRIVDLEKEILANKIKKEIEAGDIVQKQEQEEQAQKDMVTEAQALNAYNKQKFLGGN